MSHGHPRRSVPSGGSSSGGKGLAKHVPARLPAVGVPTPVDDGAAVDSVQNVVGSVSSSSPLTAVEIAALSQGGAYAVSPHGGVVRQVVVEEEIRRRTTTTEYVSCAQQLPPPPGAYREDRELPPVVRPEPQLVTEAARPVVVEPAVVAPVKKPYDGPFVYEPPAGYGQPLTSSMPGPAHDFNSNRPERSHLFRVVIPAVIALILLVCAVVFGKMAMNSGNAVVAVVLLFGGCVGAASLIAGSYYASRNC